MCFDNWLKNSLTLSLIFAGLISFFSFPESSAAFVRQRRAIEADETGISNPAGLAFSSKANAFHVVAGRRENQLLSSDTDISKLTPFGKQIGVARIMEEITDSINMAFDNKANRLLIFLSSVSRLINVLEGPDGNLDLTTLILHDASHFGLQNPQGMTIDPVSGHLFILDTVGPRILRIEPESDGGFANALISEVDLQPTGLVDVRGLAFDPTTGHLHVLRLSEQKLYEVTQTGQVVATRGLSEFGLSNPQSMVFAPSGDLTDDASELSLYIADSGLPSTQQNQGGQLLQSSQAATSSMPGEIVELVIHRTTGCPGEQLPVLFDTDHQCLAVVTTQSRLGRDCLPARFG